MDKHDDGRVHDERVRDDRQRGERQADERLRDDRQRDERQHDQRVSEDRRREAPRITLVEAAMRSPWSVINAALIVVGGCGVWYTLISDLTRLQDRVASHTTQLTELREKVSQNERDADQKLMLLQRDVTDVKVSTRGIEASLSLLVRQMVGRPGAPP